MATPGVHPGVASPARYVPPSRLRLDIIPTGIVQSRRQAIEANLAPQDHGNNSLLLKKAQNNSRALADAYPHQTYAGRLRAAETLGLCNLTPSTPPQLLGDHHSSEPKHQSLYEFLHDHEAMHMTTVRAHLALRSAQRDPNTPALRLAGYHTVTIRNATVRKWIMATLHSSALVAMREDGRYDAEIVKVERLLESEFIRILTSWDQSTITDIDEEYLENVGPDHDIDGFGKIVKAKSEKETTINDSSSGKLSAPPPLPVPSPAPSPLPTPPPSPPRDAVLEETVVGIPGSSSGDGGGGIDGQEDDHAKKCMICKDKYSDSHPAFYLDRCGHIFGKHCILAWINSIARNANQCPACRRELCTRRPRRPIPTVYDYLAPHPSVQTALGVRMHETLFFFQQLAKVFGGLWGQHTEEGFMKNCIFSLNSRFFHGGYGWALMPDPTAPYGWTPWRCDWAGAHLFYAVG